MYQPGFQPHSPLSPESLLQRKSFWIVIATLLSLLSGGCGSSSKSSQNISPAQAQAISQEIVTALQGALTSVSGDFSVTLDNSGNGADSSAITVTPSNCSVSNLTINGEPDVLVATQFNIANYQLQFPMTLTEAGGISYGPNPRGSCLLDVSVTISSQTTCTVSGNVCGQPVSGTC